MKRIAAIILTVVLAMSSMSLLAQQANTLYWMDRVFQSQTVNVSEIPANNVQVGGLIVPLFGQLPPAMYFNYGNNSFHYNHIIHHGEGTKKDSLVLDLPLLMKKVQKTTNIRNELRIDYFNLSVKTKKNAVLDFTLADRILIGASVPRDMFEFLLNGNRPYMLEGKPHDLSRLAFSATYFHEFGVGYTASIGDRLSVGGRVKLLFGVADVSSKADVLELNTDPDNYFITATANMQIRKTSNLFSLVTDGEDGASFETDFSTEALKQTLTTVGNLGLGLDVGVTYNLGDKIRLSFAATDLGFIGWTQNSQIASAKGDYTFEGVELGIKDGGEGKLSFGLDENRYNAEHILDTVVEMFDMKVENKNYTSWLPSNIYLGATYQLHEKIGFGVLYRGEVYKKSYMQSLTVSANSNITHWLSLHASWSYMNNTAANIGFGLSARLGFITWYIVSDDILGMIFPQKAKTLNLHMGCTLTFGHPKKVSKTQTRL